MKRVLILLSMAIFIASSISCSSEKSIEQGESVEISSSIPLGDNSQTSLDWKGVYKGTLPCADCEGIETTIILKSDDTFRRSLNYLGKENGVFSDEGAFKWNENGSKVSLQPEEGDSQLYLVGENALYHLDKQGNRITGDLEDKYRLLKNLTDPSLEDKKWVLEEVRGVPVTKGQGLKEAFILFEMETASFNGNGSCNNFFGPYELLEGNKIAFGNTASTMMACLDMQVEKEFLEVLRMVDNYSVGDSTLSIQKAKMAPLARFTLEKQELPK
ncbi:copper resistance protein NlpE N-terminal domain-containing protein [Aquiflexum gelatinilyticum]|uniref:copper resistance protein NlpE N-terminal domain-containing protein n=1 Tax=Aquiflexum gelatinilyticum TaxID=2961943 RepID=UPI002168D618|nr:copper resistance protein NlpE N-terminal domain-containing protein [Aquiflexum gelatinilyticum]MCS4433203.1 copper resistance protein NlpE N-terminal domain-containing protein [Aquiflexum gelatinilyticum]